MKVKDAMHKGVEHVAPDALVDTIAKKMKELDVGAIPVVRNGELVGMITDRDITIRCVASGKDPTKLTAEDLMTGALFTAATRKRSKTPFASWRASRFVGCLSWMRRSVWSA